MVGWNVLECDRASSREIRSWNFPTFIEAEEFRRNREEFYETVGLDKERCLTNPSPEVSPEEIELLEKIMRDPELLASIKRCWASMIQREGLKSRSPVGNILKLGQTTKTGGTVHSRIKP